ncbi:hypothetical protein TWF730_007355 [Orbilia blumenaviensis]|uniref:Uncharacterized protein n=1 Tax=Orbilia blumenaviensis TaxID=1796055 RepID=A0AAV9VA47_9PEZI
MVQNRLREAKPGEKSPPGTKNTSPPSRRVQQKANPDASVTLNVENTPPKVSRGGNPALACPRKLSLDPTGTKSHFKFGSPQDLKIDFQYQSNASTSVPGASTNHQGKSDQDADTKEQPILAQSSAAKDKKTSQSNAMKNTAAPGVDSELEDTILLDDSYVLPKGPKSPSGTSVTSGRVVKSPVPPSKKFVKFVMPYRGDSTASSFDNIRRLSGDGTQGKGSILGPQKKKRASSSISTAAPEVYKPKDCVLTPAAQVDLEQLKLRALEKDNQLSTLETTILQITDTISELEERLKASESANAKIRKDFEALKKSQQKNNPKVDEIDDDDDDEPKPLYQNIRRICQVFIIAMIVYVVLGGLLR